MSKAKGALRWIRHKMATTPPGKVLAIVAEDGAWVNGAKMTLEQYRAAYDGRAREELTIAGIRLEDLAGRGQDAGT